MLFLMVMSWRFMLLLARDIFHSCTENVEEIRVYMLGHFRGRRSIEIFISFFI